MTLGWSDAVTSALCGSCAGSGKQQIPLPTGVTLFVSWRVRDFVRRGVVKCAGVLLFCYVCLLV